MWPIVLSLLKMKGKYNNEGVCPKGIHLGGILSYTPFHHVVKLLPMEQNIILSCATIARNNAGALVSTDAWLHNIIEQSELSINQEIRLFPRAVGNTRNHLLVSNSMPMLSTKGNYSVTLKWQEGNYILMLQTPGDQPSTISWLDYELSVTYLIFCGGEWTQLLALNCWVGLITSDRHIM